MALIVGLTGSFGSGKSTVAAIFKEFGVPVQDADQVAREVVQAGASGLKEIVREFGEGVLDTQGGLDRKKMADHVFADPSARRKLNAIIHPRVREEQARFIQTHAAAPMIVLEIPLLLESGGRGLMNKVVVVTASERIRFGRLRKAGFTEKEIIARLGSQMPQGRKVQLADFVVENDGEIAQTREQVKKFLRETCPQIEAQKDEKETIRTPAECGAN